MNSYLIDVEAYLRETAHLTLMEHVAYFLLVNAYSREKMPIPEAQVYDIARATTPEEREAVKYVILRYFAKVPGGFTPRYLGWMHQDNRQTGRA